MTDTKDRLAEIRSRLESTDRLPYLKNTQPGADISWLLDAYKHSGETVEAYSESLTKAEAEIERLRSLKVTGIPFKGKVT